MSPKKLTLADALRHLAKRHDVVKSGYWTCGKEITITTDRIHLAINADLARAWKLSDPEFPPEDEPFHGKAENHHLSQVLAEHPECAADLGAALLAGKVGAAPRIKPKAIAAYLDALLERAGLAVGEDDGERFDALEDGGPGLSDDVVRAAKAGIEHGRKLGEESIQDDALYTAGQAARLLHLNPENVRKKLDYQRKNRARDGDVEERDPLTSEIHRGAPRYRFRGSFIKRMFLQGSAREARYQTLVQKLKAGRKTSTPVKNIERLLSKIRKQ
jgi:hypothetical protein